MRQDTPAAIATVFAAISFVRALRPPSLLSAVLLCGWLSATPALAQVLDISGVRIGMTRPEALATLTNAFGRAPDDTGIIQARMMNRSENYVIEVTYEFRFPNIIDSVHIRFSEHGRVLHIVRVTQFGNNEFRSRHLEGFATAVAQKYGQLSGDLAQVGGRPGEEVGVWHFTRDAQTRATPTSRECWIAFIQIARFFNTRSEYEANGSLSREFQNRNFGNLSSKCTDYLYIGSNDQDGVMNQTLVGIYAFGESVLPPLPRPRL